MQLDSEVYEIENSEGCFDKFALICSENDNIREVICFKGVCYKLTTVL